MRLGKRQLQELLFYMLLTRALEETLARLHREGEMSSPLGLRSGLEAVAVGSAFAPAPKDTLSSSLPSLGCLLLRGVKPAEIVAQFLGKATAPSGGRDGLRDLGDLERGVVATAGHAAAHVSVMAGLAYSYRFYEQERVAVALVGERAFATGDFHEGVNFAAVKKIPLVLVLVRIGRLGQAGGGEVAQLYERVKGYGMAGLPVDGGDLLQVLQVVQTAVGRARTGAGPTFIEATVSRSVPYVGSSLAVPSPFETASLPSAGAPDREPAARGSEGAEADAIWRFEKLLLQQDWLGEAERASLARRVDDAVAEALAAAEAAPSPAAPKERVAALRSRALRGAEAAR